MKYNKQAMIEVLKHSIEVAKERIEELKKAKSENNYTHESCRKRFLEEETEKV